LRVHAPADRGCYRFGWRTPFAGTLLVILLTSGDIMNRTLMLAIGGLLAVFSACLLGWVVVAGQGYLLGPDLAQLEPYLGTAGVVVAGIGLVLAALLVGIGMGRWDHPKPVPTSAARRGEGLQQ